ncbi:hypothetical protein CBS101457_002262 [Exobasidium rhododendri]|nr:hypothetical protein CBS101457_002262 [Exobasidium rhododendri]
MAPATLQAGRGKPKRKRARKTRTAVVSDASSSSSSSSDSDSSDNEVLLSSSKGKVKGDASLANQMRSSSDSNSSSSSSSSSSSDNSSSSESESDSDNHTAALQALGQRAEKGSAGKRRLQYTPPPEDYSSMDIQMVDSDDEIAEGGTLRGQCLALRPPPPILRSLLIEEAQDRRREALAKKQRSRKPSLATNKQAVDNGATREEYFQAVYMRIVIDEFGEELDALRKKEPNLTAESGSRMPLLIDALQAGSELFSRGSTSSKEHSISLGDSDEVGLMLWGNQMAN